MRSKLNSTSDGLGYGGRNWLWPILKSKHMYGRTDKTSWGLRTLMLMTKILFRLSWMWSGSAINIV